VLLAGTHAYGQRIDWKQPHPAPCDLLFFIVSNKREYPHLSCNYNHAMKTGDINRTESIQKFTKSSPELITTYSNNIGAAIATPTTRIPTFLHSDALSTFTCSLALFRFGRRQALNQPLNLLHTTATAHCGTGLLLYCLERCGAIENGIDDIHGLHVHTNLSALKFAIIPHPFYVRYKPEADPDHCEVIE
jgi:hypothetical protein